MKFGGYQGKYPYYDAQARAKLEYLVALQQNATGQILNRLDTAYNDYSRNSCGSVKSNVCEVKFEQNVLQPNGLMNEEWRVVKASKLLKAQNLDNIDDAISNGTIGPGVATYLSVSQILLPTSNTDVALLGAGSFVSVGGKAYRVVKNAKGAVTGFKSATGEVKTLEQLKAEARVSKQPHIQIGDEPYIAPKNTTGSFQTHGISVNDVPNNIKNAMLQDIKSSGNKNPVGTLNEYITSGNTVPIAKIADKNTKLYKLVNPDGQYTTPSPNTAYWIDQKQYDLIKAHPDRVNDILGLPESSQASRFKVFEITPKSGQNPRIYQSNIATTTNPSGLTNVGNAVQTIVPNRSLWNTPKATGVTIKVK